MDKEIVVRALNGLIIEALMHGGDPGGPYYCNEDLLMKSMEYTKECFGLNDYKIKEIDTLWEDEFGRTGSVRCHQFIKV